MASDLPALRIVNASDPRPCKKCSFRHKFRRHPPDRVPRPHDGQRWSPDEGILPPAANFFRHDRLGARLRGSTWRTDPAEIRLKYGHR